MGQGIINKGRNQKPSFEERMKCKLACKRIRYVHGFSTHLYYTEL